MSGWGVKFFDYDNDGDSDLLVANGHPDTTIEARHARVTYKQPLSVFHQNAKALENVSASSGPAFRESYAARGMAIGDFNYDGAMDVLVSVKIGVPVLLKNVAAAHNHWLGLRLIGKQSNPDAAAQELPGRRAISSAASKKLEAEATFHLTTPAYCSELGREGGSTGWRFAGPSSANVLTRSRM